MNGAASLEFIFTPRSVALIGASNNPEKFGGRIVGNLLDNGFKGSVFPVNPGMREIRGLPCYPSVESLPEAVDVAYVLVPADAAVDAAWALGRSGATAAIIAAAGFAETDTDRGREREASLAAAAQATGIRLVGPNCNGIYNATDSVSIGFNTAHGMMHRAGGMGVLSHSGALFSTLMLRSRRLGVGLSKFVSVGNEADLNILDFMEDLAYDEPTRCICMVIDSLPDADRFAELATLARERSKRVVVLKLGTSPEGALAAVAHSSRLAGRTDAYMALFRHCGVGTVSSIEQLVSAAALVEQGSNLSPRPRLGIVTMSGGASAILADAASRLGVSVPPLSPAAMSRIAHIAPGAPVVNPIDCGAIGGQAVFPHVLEILGVDDGVDVIVHYYHPMVGDAERSSCAEELAASKQRCGKPHVLLAPGGLTDTESSWYARAGITVFDDTHVCMAALSAAGADRPPGQRPAWRPETPDLPLVSGPLDDVASFKMLQAAGLPVAAFRVAYTPDSAASAARELGWPVVLKGLAPGAVHKSDHGRVITAVGDPERCRELAESLLAGGATRVLVQPQLTADLEALAGLISEPNLGVFVVLGLGGVHAEALADTATVPATATREEIASALASTKLGAILRSRRWREPSTFERMTEVLASLAAFGSAVAGRVKAADLNPLIIRGSDIVAVDALVVMNDASGSQPPSGTTESAPSTHGRRVENSPREAQP